MISDWKYPNQNKKDVISVVCPYLFLFKKIFTSFSLHKSGLTVCFLNPINGKTAKPCFGTILLTLPRREFMNGHNLKILSGKKCGFLKIPQIKKKIHKKLAYWSTMKQWQRKESVNC